MADPGLTTFRWWASTATALRIYTHGQWRSTGQKLGPINPGPVRAALMSMISVVGQGLPIMYYFYLTILARESNFLILLARFAYSRYVSCEHFIFTLGPSALE